MTNQKYILIHTQSSVCSAGITVILRLIISILFYLNENGKSTRVTVWLTKNSPFLKLLIYQNIFSRTQGNAAA